MLGLLTIRDFVNISAKNLGISIKWVGKGINEKGIISKTSNKNYKFKVGQVVVSVDPKYFRPSEVDILVGDASKAKRELNWEPKISLEELVSDMMVSDLKVMKKDLDLLKLGYSPKNHFE